MNVKVTFQFLHLKNGGLGGILDPLPGWNLPDPLYEMGEVNAYNARMTVG